MERRRRVELFEQIRREYEHGCGTIIGTAQKPDRKRTKFDLVKGFIEQILLTDERAPRKQRHTAHRIFVRLRAEMPQVEVTERSIRGYVEEIRGKLGLAQREVFIPQHYQFGSEAQVDWYEATVELGGTR